MCTVAPSHTIVYIYMCVFKKIKQLTFYFVFRISNCVQYTFL